MFGSGLMVSIVKAGLLMPSIIRRMQARYFGSAIKSAACDVPRQLFCKEYQHHSDQLQRRAGFRHITENSLQRLLLHLIEKLCR